MNKLIVFFILTSTIGFVKAQPHHEYFNLGLTSGTLWATCNVVTETAKDIGDYFSWGDTLTIPWWSVYYQNFIQPQKKHRKKYIYLLRKRGAIVGIAAEDIFGEGEIDWFAFWNVKTWGIFAFWNIKFCGVFAFKNVKIRKTKEFCAVKRFCSTTILSTRLLAESAIRFFTSAAKFW